MSSLPRVLAQRASIFPCKRLEAWGEQLRAQALSCPVMFVRDHYGEERLLSIVAGAGLTMDQLTEKAGWVSEAQFAAFLEELRKAVPSDKAFRAACIYRILEVYGTVRLLSMAMAPAAMISLCARAAHLISRVSRTTVIEQGRNVIRLRYRSSTPEDETRLTCLFRRVQSAAMPTFLGLPLAHVKEHSCIAHGDDACEYTYSFYTRASWLPAALGFVIGALLVAALMLAPLSGSFFWSFIPVLGALCGGLIELRATYRANLRFGDDVRETLRELASNEGEARREIMAMHSRQKEWGRLLEEQVDDRTNTLRTVMTQLQAVGEEQVVNMRDFSHDLRNPLAVLAANSRYLRNAMTRICGQHEHPHLSVLERDALMSLRDNLGEALDDNEQAIRSMERMLTRLTDNLVGNSDFVRLAPETIEVAPQVDRLRRRVRALVYGRDIRVSVFQTREAPETFACDPLVFERVVDNLCTNAAKYTDRGSIVIELDGNPDSFILQVSDTGRGIAPHLIEEVVKAQGSDPDTRAAKSYGIGLSVTIQLLQQIGGHLEIDSKVGIGSTFWAYFPRNMLAPLTTYGPASTNVIDIRQAVKNS